MADQQDGEATETDEESSQDENDSENPIKRQPVRRRTRQDSKRSQRAPVTRGLAAAH